MVAAALRRALWPALAALAAATLVFLALRGDRPGMGEDKSEPAGLMRHMAPSSIDEIEVRSAAALWRFARVGPGWLAQAGSPPPPDAAARIESALDMLHRVAPERILSDEELAAPASYGLDPPALTVRVSGSARFAVAFGAPNPLGHARYARAEGQAGIALVPGHVAEAWESAVGLR